MVSVLFDQWTWANTYLGGNKINMAVCGKCGNKQGNGSVLEYEE